MIRHLANYWSNILYICAIGRIKQLIEYEVLKTGAIRLFVLDEADKLLDDTFQEQVK